VPPEKWTHAIPVGKGFSADATDAGQLLRELREGATIVLDTYEDHDATIRSLCRRMEWELHCPVHATVFVTPPGEEGLALHIDNKDVFVVQISGAKHWKVFQQLNPVPDTSHALPDTDPGSPTIDTLLNVGDCLYIPKGTPHVAAAPDVISIHVSLLSKPSTWAELMRNTFEQLISDQEYQETPNLLNGALELEQQYRLVTKNLSGAIAASALSDHCGNFQEGHYSANEQITDIIQDLSASFGDDNVRIIAADELSIEPISTPNKMVEFRCGKTRFRMPLSYRQIGMELLKTDGISLAQIMSNLGPDKGRQLVNQLILHAFARIK